jgi:hypothetical protein
MQVLLDSFKKAGALLDAQQQQSVTPVSPQTSPVIAVPGPSRVAGETPASSLSKSFGRIRSRSVTTTKREKDKREKEKEKSEREVVTTDQKPLLAGNIKIEFRELKYIIYSTLEGKAIILFSHSYA